MLNVYQPLTPVHWNWISLVGADAQDFLHRLTTVHVKALKSGTGSPGFFLTAQGKIRAYFTLWCVSAGQYAFELDGGKEDHWKKELLATIDQFTFAEKITVTPATDLDCRWVFGDLPFHLAQGQTIEVDGVRLCRHQDSEYGKPWTTAWGNQKSLDAWSQKNLQGAQEVSFETLETWRVLSLRPKVDTEITEGANPLEIGLRDAISDNKGCYPGQEVIEKIISLGSPPKRLARIDGEGQTPSAGEKLLNLEEPPTEIGEITSVVSCEGKFSALGLIKKIHAKEGLEVRVAQNPIKASIVRISSYE